MTPRWSVSRKALTKDGELLFVERKSKYKLQKKYYATDGIRTRTRFLSIG